MKILITVICLKAPHSRHDDLVVIYLPQQNSGSDT